MPASLWKIRNACRRGVTTLFRAGADFIYPRSCPLCGVEDEALTAGGSWILSFCSNCEAELTRDTKDLCRRCGAPVGPLLDTTKGCIHCRRDLLVFETVIPLGGYEGLLRTVCLRAKEPSGLCLAAAAGRLLAMRAHWALAAADVDCVVAVPHHWSERLRRPHFPSETLAGVLAHVLHVEYLEHILRKVRRTPAQSSLPASKRRTNLRNAFAVRSGLSLEGRSVLLADDILTTGTTANEATKALLRAGAERVVVAVLARGLGSSRWADGDTPQPHKTNHRMMIDHG